MADQWTSKFGGVPVQDEPSWQSKFGGQPVENKQSPAAPKTPLPFELRSDSEQGNPFWSSPNGLIRGGLRQALHGVEHAAEPGWNPKMGGASQVMRGLGKALLPAAIPFAAANPITTLAGAAAAIPADVGVHYGAKALGASPEGADLAGDVAGAGAGMLGGSLGSKLQGFVSMLKNGGRATQDALTDLIPYWGSKINKLRNIADNSPRPFVPGPPVEREPPWRAIPEPSPRVQPDFQPIHGMLPSGRVPGTGVPATNPRVANLSPPGERMIASPSEAATPLRKPEGFSWEGMPRRFELQHLRDRGPLTPVAQAEHLAKWMKSQGISAQEANSMSQGEWKIAAGSAGVPEPSHEIIQAARGQLSWRRGFRK